MLDSLTEEEWDQIYLNCFMENLRKSREDFENGRYMFITDWKKQFKEKHPTIKFE